MRRIFEEMLTTLPRELGGGPVTTVTRGVRWASVTLEAEPKVTVRLVVQSRDSGTAKALNELVQDALKLIGRAAQNRRSSPAFARDLAQIKAEVVNDRVVLEVNPEQASSLVAVPVDAALESLRRRKCVNNLKLIALAMHNYHSARKAFPTAYSRDKEGRPLLSWRVHLLPFLEQQSLYDQFHLDEPWDSPHNQALIARIPAVYVCPGANRTLGKSGKTVYLAPRGKATIFPGGKAEGVKIADVTDGTANTVLVFEADDPRAVVWTKPDDWEVGPELKTDGLFGHHPGGTNAAFADGSVHFLKQTIAPAVLYKLLTRNGNDRVSADDY